MADWKKAEMVEPKKRYHAIRCFTCGKDLPGKQACKLHRGHDVDYVNEKGEIDE